MELNPFVDAQSNTFFSIIHVDNIVVSARETFNDDDKQKNQMNG